MSNEDHKKVQERGAQAFRRLIIWPSGALLITILLLVIHKPLIAALVAAFGVYYTSTKTLPAILNRHISKMIQASEYEGAEKMARFGVWWCRSLKLESISNLPRSFSWDILMKKHLGQALLQQGRFEESIATNKEIYQVLEVERDIAGSAAVIGSLAFCYIQTGQFSEATNLTSKSVMLLESAMRNAESSQDSKARAYRAQLGMALFEQATLLETRRQFEAAEPIRRKALAVTSKLYDDDDALQLMPHISMLGKVLIRLVRYEEAEPLLLKVQEVRAKHLPDKHILVASSKHGLGQLYCETDRFD
ncbi:MAG: hypothetical protein K8F91_18110, partial [Candidatus Obscuribacterales bacterium]|nr:hypothetical protein [Candidatus Obscuribacterales bacterium]